jgi:hypothetical protein
MFLIHSNTSVDHLSKYEEEEKKSRKQMLTVRRGRGTPNQISRYRIAK